MLSLAILNTLFQINQVLLIAHKTVHCFVLAIGIIETFSPSLAVGILLSLKDLFVATADSTKTLLMLIRTKDMMELDGLGLFSHVC